MNDRGQAARVRELFDEKASAWASKYAQDGALRWRIKEFVDAVAAYCQPPARVLDFGCGTGDIASALAQRGYAVAACDISAPMLERARRAHGEQVRWIELTDPRLPAADGQFDAVVASSVIEYVPDANAVVMEFARVIRASGHLLFTAPDVRHAIRRLERVSQLMARTRIADWAGDISPKARSYVEYLRLSKNRLAVRDWVCLARQCGFDCSAQPRRMGALLLFEFVRQPR